MHWKPLTFEAMSSRSPLVSIISPCFNHAPFIGKCIESVQNQTFEDWEMIIMDDGSSDGSVEIIKSYAEKDPRISLFQSPYNRGIGSATTAASQKARGKYMALLDTDDVYLPTKLEKQVTYMESHPECGAIFSHINIIDDDDQKVTEHYLLPLINTSNTSRVKILEKLFFEGNFLACPTELIRSDVFRQMGYYQNGLILTADFNTHIKVLFTHDIHIIQEPLVNYRVRKNSKNTSAPSSANLFRATNEMNILLDTFLELKDLDLFLKTFGEKASNYGIPTVDTLPYFFARMAIDHKDYLPNWGYQTLIKLMNDSVLYEKLHSLFGFDFKTFLGLPEKNNPIVTLPEKNAPPSGIQEDNQLSAYRKKSKKYRQAFTLQLILNAILIILILTIIWNNAKIP